MTGKPPGPSAMLGPDYLAPDESPIMTFLRLAAYLSYMQAEAAASAIYIRGGKNART